ncbi:hypothetical protein E2320_013788 [Naja naja]|nr:hypothetical protein E2320_013788 [Naja naja]
MEMPESPGFGCRWQLLRCHRQRLLREYAAAHTAESGQQPLPLRLRPLWLPSRDPEEWQVGDCGLASGWTCYHPEPLLDMAVIAYTPRLTQCSVMVVVAIAVSITAVVVIAIMVLCWRFNVPWYLKATLQVVRSKYRSGRSKPLRDFAYHAFISYSCSDADWVRRELLQRLEASTPPYRICIHERDFTPGRWIIDNIIENIENSRKIIFVLSRSFVDSDWCNYELYFAHQRAVGMNFEDVVLVVKEAIDPQALPNKFCRLRKMLSKRTYLEWPSEPGRQAFFWVQLTSVLGRAEVIEKNPKGDLGDIACRKSNMADDRLEMDTVADADEVEQD